MTEVLAVVAEISASNAGRAGLAGFRRFVPLGACRHAAKAGTILVIGDRFLNTAGRMLVDRRGVTGRVVRK